MLTNVELPEYLSTEYLIHGTTSALVIDQITPSAANSIRFLPSSRLDRLFHLLQLSVEDNCCFSFLITSHRKLFKDLFVSLSSAASSPRIPTSTVNPAATMSTLREITSEEEFATQLSSLPPTALAVLSFHTPWAAPCQQMHAVLSALASTYPATTPPTISFLSINAEELPEISERYDVSAVPFLVLLRDNKVVDTVSGSDPIRVREAIEKQVTLSTGQEEGQPSIPPPLTAVPRQTAAEDDVDGTPLSSTTGGATSQAAGTLGGEELPTPTKEELFARLTELVSAAPVMLFMKGTPSGPQCGFSRQIVAILRENGVKYGFFNILADEDVRQGLKEFADWPTFPQLWVKGELVGGLDIVS